MRKFTTLLISFLFATSLFAAKPKPAPVNEDAFLVQKEISIWPTDQGFNSDVTVYSCQAVRLDENWFLTSAHCVYSACGTRPCTVDILLAESAGLLARAKVNHSTTSQSVFIYRGFFPGQNRISGMDVALIKLDPKKAEYSYVNLEDGEPITREEFQTKLRFDSEAQAQLNAKGVRLLSVANMPTIQLKPQIVVPKMIAGVLSYLPSPSPEVYYVQDLQHFIVPGFGVRQGNSGGGVFTRSGDLAGIVSSLLYNKDGTASFHDADGKTVLTLKNAKDLFMFTGFNGTTLNFIRTKVPNLRTVSVVPDFAVKSDKKFDSIVKAEEETSMQF